MFTSVSILILLALTSIFARADPSPNSPGPGDVFIEEKSCLISWDVDQTGDWTTTHIDLMTGNNFDMIFLTNVGVVDATDRNDTVFRHQCPKVIPHSPIYFYQFSTPSSSNKTWTGRFAITDHSDDIVAPSESIQPDGQHIPWGKGALDNDTQPYVFPSSFGASGSPNGSSTAASPFGISVALASRSSATLSSIGVSVKNSTDPSVAATTTQSSGLAPTISSSSGVLKAGQNGAMRIRWSGTLLALGVFRFAVMF